MDNKTKIMNEKFINFNENSLDKEIFVFFITLQARFEVDLVFSE